MRYKGFVILPEKYILSNKIAYYNIYDPMDGGKRYCAENSINECKKTIDELLLLLNMKSNHLKEWQKLDGFNINNFNVMSLEEVERENKDDY